MDWRIRFILLFWLGSHLGFGQQKLIDSLSTQSRRADISVEQRVVTLSDLGMALRNHNKTEALSIGQEAVDLGRTLKDGQYVSYAYTRIYYTYRSVDSVLLLLNAIDSAMWYARQSKNPLAIGNAFRIAGNYENYRLNGEKATANLLEALGYLENTNDYHSLSNTCYMLGANASAIGDLEKQENYARLSLKAAESGDINAQCLSLLSTSDFFKSKYDKTGEQTDQDSLFYYVKKAIKTYEDNESMVKERFVGETAALNYASYLFVYKPEVPRDTVIAEIQKSLNWATENKDWTVVANCYGLMSEYFSMEGKYDQAEKLLLAGLDLMIEHNSPSSAMSNIASGLVRLSDRRNDKDKVIKYQNMYLDYYKKSYNERYMQTVKTLEAQYNHKKKEQEVTTLQKRALYNRNFGIGITVAWFVIILFLFVIYRLRLKSALQEKYLLEMLSKDVILEQRFKEEQVRRLETEQHVTMQQNEQLKKEVLVGAVRLKQKNELLETVQKEIANPGSASRVERIIKDNLVSDEYFEEYKTLIKETHPDFFNRLQELADKKLTELDLKYCAYIYMNIPSKQIASLLHVEYSTIRVNKARLKKKFNLQKDEDLNLFIKRII